MPFHKSLISAASVLTALQMAMLPYATAQSRGAPDLKAVAARPGFILRAIYIQTDSHYSTERKYYQFRENVPYKKPVRIISNLFEIPEKLDVPKDGDIGTQFYEHILAKHPDWVEKLRGHQRDETLDRVTFFKGSEQIGAHSYRGLFDAGSDPKWQYEILYVDDFKYVDRKVQPGWSKAKLKARSIIGDPAAGKP